MGVVKAASTRRSNAKEVEQQGSRAVETLVRQLVAHAEHIAHAPAPARTTGDDEDPSDDVLLACEVDGVRCVLARPHQPPDDILALSPRETEVARMIAKGYPNKIIASVLDISVWTVSTHLRRIFAKLGVTSRAAMVSRMLKRGKL
jgi:DNA-binding NarL/FixJ family response regulator